ncbi:hypothetical protein LZ31DRAFT_127940 [Colletotrichum somersetense]|nr:hypothetical protein LZ31DRAFT_127940 [Colletotrichum somersetense]
MYIVYRYTPVLSPAEMLAPNPPFSSDIPVFGPRESHFPTCSHPPALCLRPRFIYSLLPPSSLSSCPYCFSPSPQLNNKPSLTSFFIS